MTRVAQHQFMKETMTKENMKSFILCEVKCHYYISFTNFIQYSFLKHLLWVHSLIVRSSWMVHAIFSFAMVSFVKSFTHSESTQRLSASDAELIAWNPELEYVKRTWLLRNNLTHMTRQQRLAVSSNHFHWPRARVHNPIRKVLLFYIVLRKHVFWWNTCICETQINNISTARVLYIG